MNSNYLVEDEFCNDADFLFLPFTDWTCIFLFGCRVSFILPPAGIPDFWEHLHSSSWLRHPLRHLTTRSMRSANIQNGTFPSGNRKEPRSAELWEQQKLSEMDEYLFFARKDCFKLGVHWRVKLSRAALESIYFLQMSRDLLTNTTIILLSESCSQNSKRFREIIDFFSLKLLRNVIWLNNYWLKLFNSSLYVDFSFFSNYYEGTLTLVFRTKQIRASRTRENEHGFESIRGLSRCVKLLKAALKWTQRLRI